MSHQDQNKPLSSQQNQILDLEENYFKDLLNIFNSPSFTKSLKKTEKWVQSNYVHLAKWGNANKVQLACQRLIHFEVMKNLPNIIGVYASAISSDIAFETNDAIINIDSKTVSETGNPNDFKSLFLGPNQASFDHKHYAKQSQFPGLEVPFSLPSIDNISKKPVLTFFLLLKYFDNKTIFEWFKDDNNVRFICLPNGELSNLFNDEIITNPKTYAYFKNGNTIISKPLNHKFGTKAINITVNSKKGYYLNNVSPNEIWLETDIGTGANRKRVFCKVKGLHSVRIDFSTLKTRYNSKKIPWVGYKSWKF